VLTELKCKNAKGREKPFKLSDSHGLYLWVTPRGYRSWRWNYRFAGKEQTITLGQYPELSLRDARAERTALDKVRRGGTDPRGARQQGRAARTDAEIATFESVARHWHTQWLSRWGTVHAANIIKGLEREIFPHIGHLPIAQIKPRTILEALKTIEQRGAVERAHRTRRFITAIFKTAIGMDLAEQNPAEQLEYALQPKPKNRPQPALRNIEDAQALLHAAETAPGQPVTKLASRLLAITAARSGSLRHAEPHEFEDLDTDQPVWRIPAAKMKLESSLKRQEAFEFIVPLPRQAVEIVRLAMRLSPGDKYLFPSTRRPNKPMSENALSTMYRRFPQFASRHVPHGWRSTFSTIMNERAQLLQKSSDRQIIDLMLAHKPSGVEALYNRADFMPRRREIAQEWADLLLGPLPPAAALTQGPRR
jgi:hypothetical protein